MIWKKYISVLLLIFLFAIALGYDYQVASKKDESSVVNPNYGSVRLFGYDRADDGGFILRENQTNSTFYLYFGNVSTNQNTEFYSAFSISNEMEYEIEITGISVIDMRGNLSNNIEIYLHNLSNSNTDSYIVFENSTTYRISWNLYPGDGNFSTAGNYVLNYSRKYNVYYGNGTMDSTYSDFVFVGFKIYGSKLEPDKIYEGYVWIYYKYGAIKLWYYLQTGGG